MSLSCVGSTQRTSKDYALMTKLERRLKKAYVKMLKAFCRHNYAKGYNLEQKIIKIELELKETDERLR